MVQLGHLVNIEIIGEGVGDAVDEFAAASGAEADHAVAAFDLGSLPELAGQVEGAAETVMGHRRRRWLQPAGEPETYWAFLPFHEVKSTLLERDMAAPRSEYRATTIIWWNGVRAYNPGDPVDARAVDGPDGWISVDDVEPSGVIPLPRPAANASQGTWAAYAVQQGHDPDEAIGMSRAALIDATKDD